MNNQAAYAYSQSYTDYNAQPANNGNQYNDNTYSNYDYNTQTASNPYSTNNTYQVQPQYSYQGGATLNHWEKDQYRGDDYYNNGSHEAVSTQYYTQPNNRERDLNAENEVSNSYYGYTEEYKQSSNYGGGYTITSSQGQSYSEIMEQLRATGGRYRDQDFPPNLRSLTGDQPKKDRNSWSQLVWLSPDQFWGKGNYAVFQNSIQPLDIEQGRLGDCYFLSSVAAIAEYENRIKRIFVSQEVNDHGCYCVMVCDMGEWKEVIVDDLFPCVNQQNGPAFTHSIQKELWVLILEKAWANLYGSYDRIESGLSREVLHDLTGCLLYTSPSPRDQA
eukprot:TRINITY_DN16385_c0_g1_i1.p1 TRINITY_DN16385_c0_g1~~TRINITY_DN16385_c0_g1_i1.p1  ORF type:complete len:331 (-),score=49.18 TRINITY_DN16385_c0_g1_i1:35-1027(-)